MPQILCCLLAFSTGSFAHPIQYHMKPLGPATVERVLESMEGMIVLLEQQGGAQPVVLPEGAMGISVLSWVLPESVSAIDDATPADSEKLSEILAASGYADPEIGAYQWKIDAERVLETYEVLARDLDMEAVDDAFAMFEVERGRLSAAATLEREAALFRDEAMVQTTWMDRELIEQFMPTIAGMLERLGVPGE